MGKTFTLKKGAFTRMSHENGYENVQKFADDIVKYKNKGFLPNKKRITTLMLKRAYFVINSRKFNHVQSGGNLYETEQNNIDISDRMIITDHSNKQIFGYNNLNLNYYFRQIINAMDNNNIRELSFLNSDNYLYVISAFEDIIMDNDVYGGEETIEEIYMKSLNNPSTYYYLPFINDYLIDRSKDVNDFLKMVRQDLSIMDKEKKGLDIIKIFKNYYISNLLERFFPNKNKDKEHTSIYDIKLKDTDTHYFINPAKIERKEVRIYFLEEVPEGGDKNDSLENLKDESSDKVIIPENNNIKIQFLPKGDPAPDRYTELSIDHLYNYLFQNQGLDGHKYCNYLLEKIIMYIRLMFGIDFDKSILIKKTMLGHTGLNETFTHDDIEEIWEENFKETLQYWEIDGIEYNSYIDGIFSSLHPELLIFKHVELNNYKMVNNVIREETIEESDQKVNSISHIKRKEDLFEYVTWSSELIGGTSDPENTELIYRRNHDKEITLSTLDIEININNLDNYITGHHNPLIDFNPKNGKSEYSDKLNAIHAYFEYEKRSSESAWHTQETGASMDGIRSGCPVITVQNNSLLLSQREYFLIKDSIYNQITAKPEANYIINFDELECHIYDYNGKIIDGNDTLQTAVDDGNLSVLNSFIDTDYLNDPYNNEPQFQCVPGYEKKIKINQNTFNLLNRTCRALFLSGRILKEFDKKTYHFELEDFNFLTTEIISEDDINALRENPLQMEKIKPVRFVDDTDYTAKQRFKRSKRKKATEYDLGLLDTILNRGSKNVDSKEKKNIREVNTVFWNLNIYLGLIYLMENNVIEQILYFKKTGAIPINIISDDNAAKLLIDGDLGSLHDNINEINTSIMKYIDYQVLNGDFKIDGYLTTNYYNLVLKLKPFFKDNISLSRYGFPNILDDKEEIDGTYLKMMKVYLILYKLYGLDTDSDDKTLFKLLNNFRLYFRKYNSNDVLSIYGEEIAPGLEYKYTELARSVNIIYLFVLIYINTNSIPEDIISEDGTKYTQRGEAAVRGLLLNLLNSHFIDENILSEASEGEYDEDEDEMYGGKRTIVNNKKSKSNTKRKIQGGGGRKGGKASVGASSGVGGGDTGPPKQHGEGSEASSSGGSSDSDESSDGEGSEVSLRGGSSGSDESSDDESPQYIEPATLYSRLKSSETDVDDPVDDKGNTLLHLAAYVKDEKLIHLILKTDVDVNKVNEAGETPLHLAIGLDYYRIANLILNDQRVDVNKVNEAGETPLHLAVSRRNYKMVQLILKHPDVDVNIAGKEGDTPLHVAILRGNKKIILLILEKEGVDMDVKNHNGERPLELAKEQQDKFIINMIKKKMVELARGSESDGDPDDRDPDDSDPPDVSDNIFHGESYGLISILLCFGSYPFNSIKDISRTFLKCLKKDDESDTLNDVGIYIKNDKLDSTVYDYSNDDWNEISMPDLQKFIKNNSNESYLRLPEEIRSAREILMKYSKKKIDDKPNDTVLISNDGEDPDKLTYDTIISDGGEGIIVATDEQVIKDIYNAVEIEILSHNIVIEDANICDMIYLIKIYYRDVDTPYYHFCIWPYKYNPLNTFIKKNLSHVTVESKGIEFSKLEIKRMFSFMNFNDEYYLEDTIGPKQIKLMNYYYLRIGMFKKDELIELNILNDSSKEKYIWKIINEEVSYLLYNDIFKEDDSKLKDFILNELSISNNIEEIINSEYLEVTNSFIEDDGNNKPETHKIIIKYLEKLAQLTVIRRGFYDFNLGELLQNRNTTTTTTTTTTNIREINAKIEDKITKLFNAGTIKKSIIECIKKELKYLYGVSSSYNNLKSVKNGNDERIENAIKKWESIMDRNYFEIDDHKNIVMKPDIYNDYKQYLMAKHIKYYHDKSFGSDSGKEVTSEKKFNQLVGSLKTSNEYKYGDPKYEIENEIYEKAKNEIIKQSELNRLVPLNRADIFLHGPPGTGKTSICVNIAEYFSKFAFCPLFIEIDQSTMASTGFSGSEESIVRILSEGFRDVYEPILNKINEDRNEFIEENQDDISSEMKPITFPPMFIFIDELPRVLKFHNEQEGVKNENFFVTTIINNLRGPRKGEDGRDINLILQITSNDLSAVQEGADGSGAFYSRIKQGTVELVDVFRGFPGKIFLLLVIQLKNMQKTYGYPIGINEEFLKDLYDIIMKVQYPDKDHNNFEKCFFEYGWPWDKKSKRFNNPNDNENEIFYNLGTTKVEEENNRWYEFSPRAIMSIIDKTVNKIIDLKNKKLTLDDVISEKITTIKSGLITSIQQDEQQSPLTQEDVKEINKLFLVIFRSLLIESRVPDGSAKIYYDARKIKNKFD